MSIYTLKSQFQGLLRPLTNRLADRGITANHVTISACVLSCVSGLAIACFPHMHWPFLMLPLVLLLRMALNAIDGMLAREHHMKSALGAVLNELGDVISDSVTYIAFAWVTGIWAPLLIAVVLLALLTEMAGVIAVQIGASRRYDGPMGKSDRALVFGIASCVMGLGISPSIWFNLVMIGMLLLLGVTIFNRIRQALKEVAVANLE